MADVDDALLVLVVELVVDVLLTKDVVRNVSPAEVSKEKKQR